MLGRLVKPTGPLLALKRTKRFANFWTESLVATQVHSDDGTRDATLTFPGVLGAFAAAAAATVAAAASGPPLTRCDSDTTTTASDESRSKWQEGVIGKYEDRLRRFSSPEKVFEYFSSVTIDGEPYMTTEDFIHCKLLANRPKSVVATASASCVLFHSPYWHLYSVQRSFRTTRRVIRRLARGTSSTTSA